MSELKQLTSLPDFPVNSLGLKRGTLIRCESRDVEDQLGIPVGDIIPIGYDGEYVCYRSFTWSIAQLCNEIEDWKAWKVLHTLDLSDPALNEKFMREVELIELVSTH